MRTLWSKHADVSELDVKSVSNARLRGRWSWKVRARLRSFRFELIRGPEGKVDVLSGDFPKGEKKRVRFWCGGRKKAGIEAALASHTSFLAASDVH